MFRLHCNNCYRSRNLEPALTFHLSRCLHILCAGCLADTSGDQKCPLCSLALQTMPISRDMPRGMAIFFEDPNKILQRYRDISQFQSNQRASDNMELEIEQESDNTLSDETIGDFFSLDWDNLDKNDDSDADFLL